ncbi:eukaryotic translation initiation factor 5B [Oratosquilla oratoria]|uniref:eukaryotic translation initiation factor 5B n=1 Tax=Oratosquilla oratoria TaxID=337810 RepID=UPI003F773FBA
MGKKKHIKTETNGDVDALVEEIGEVKVKEAGKKGKKSKRKDEDWEDDVAKELEDMTIEEGGEVKDDEEDVEVVPQEDKKEKKKEKKVKKASKKDTQDESDEEELSLQPKMGGGFAALMADDDDDDDEDMDLNDEVDSAPIIEKVKPEKKKEKEKKAPQQEPIVEEGEDKGKKGKKGKKNRKNKGDDDEDLEKLLEEIESEYTGGKPPVKAKEEVVPEAPADEEPEAKEPVKEDDAGKKKKKKKKGQAAEEGQDALAASEPEEVKAPESEEVKAPESEEVKAPESEEVKEVPTVDKVEDKAEGESAKSKKKKKKEAQKTKQESQETVEEKPEPKEGTPAPGEEEGDEDEGTSKKKKKKKKGEKDEEEDAKGKKGKPNKKMIAAMKEALAKQKEEEERLQRIEEEKIRQEEEKIRQREEEKRLEQERKDKKKQKEKERKERLKAEGKLLTAKQKLEKKRAQEMLQHLKAQGLDVPEVGEKRPRPGARVRPKKNKQQQEEQQHDDEAQKEVEPMEVETVEKNETEEVAESWEEKEEVKDTWDMSSEEEEEEEESSVATKASEETENKKDESEEESDEDSEDEDDHQTEAEKRRNRARMRIDKRKEENEKNRQTDNLRAPVVCVLGHVDHGKTKILDKLRRTNVQEGEVGGITQQIGATNVPFEAIKNQTRMVKDFDVGSLRFPGLLIIDTPGHESFSNLRSRGSSLCDIAILVVDVTQGLEPQTLESISLLKTRKTPFIVALNKVDRVFEWDSHPSKDIRESIKIQNEPCKNDFERRTKEIIHALNVNGLNAALFWENPDPKSYVSLVPTSAISGDGMGNLISMICFMCQQRLSKRLMFSEELQCTVLEVKTIQGHGTTIDVILVNGRLREGDSIVLAGTEGPIQTQIRSLLLPKPLKEIRVKGQYDEFKEVKAAQGVKIAARDLEKAIAGLNLLVAYHDDEAELLKEDVDREFSKAMRSMKVKERGVYVQASTLGALEALLEFFKSKDIPYSGIRVGPVVKRDVMKAAAMLEHDPMYAVILAFDVKVERDAQELADKEGVRIFSELTIYHLGDRYVEYINDYKKKKQDEFRHVAVFPSRLKIIPTAIFNKRDPIVLGVTVDAGLLRTGTPLCVPSKEFVEIGIVTSMEFDHKVVELAKKGVDVCIKIEPSPGSTPKLFGRHFDQTDMLVSKISREAINACKDYFRDDLSKTDWKLMAELKKEFQIV